MQHGRGWAKGVGTVAAVVGLAAVGFVALNWSNLRQRFAAPAAQVEGEAVTTANGPARLDRFASLSDAEKAAVLDLIPELAKSPELAAKCREAVAAGLALPSAEARVQAVRLALRPEIAAKAAVVPLLGDPDAEVRRAAMLAVGPAVGDANVVVADEELFRWLHDPDLVVQDLCESALKTRGLDAVQVRLARRLTHPEPGERLRLLTDLRAAGDAVRDPGPWLERLARDPDPAVRLGAARAAHDAHLQFAKWLDALADADPDPTVRRWAGYYRGLNAAVRQTGFTEAK